MIIKQNILLVQIRIRGQKRRYKAHAGNTCNEACDEQVTFAALAVKLTVLTVTKSFR